MKTLTFVCNLKFEYFNNSQHAN